MNLSEPFTKFVSKIDYLGPYQILTSGPSSYSLTTQLNYPFNPINEFISNDKKDEVDGTDPVGR